MTSFQSFPSLFQLYGHLQAQKYQQESTGFLPYLGKQYLTFYFLFHNLSVLRNPTGALPNVTFFHYSFWFMFITIYLQQEGHDFLEMSQ